MVARYSGDTVSTFAAIVTVPGPATVTGEDIGA
jgi:hypothetical protein